MIKSPTKFIIEGLDRLGKSTLIDGIQHKLGYFKVIHYGKPQILDVYINSKGVSIDEAVNKRHALFTYQQQGFITMFELLKTDARLLFDRGHLGEMVYAPLYRHYDGNYVFDLEYQYNLDSIRNVRLILLTEDFSVSKHFIEDGESFDSSKREEEQNMFIEAFNKSCIKDKRIISVTSPEGGFKSKEQILDEALS